VIGFGYEVVRCGWLRGRGEGVVWYEEEVTGQRVRWWCATELVAY